jgi:hypothetical protein
MFVYARLKDGAVLRKSVVLSLVASISLIGGLLLTVDVTHCAGREGVSS